MKFKIPLVVGTIYLVYFLLLFLQFPLHGSLPGNVDTWYYVAIFNDYFNLLKHTISGTDYGTSLYPVPQAFIYGEPSFLPGIVFMVFKAITNNNLWSYYLFISVAYAWNAFGVYGIARGLKLSRMAAVFTGFAFASSAFLLGHKENQNAIFYGPGLTSICYLLLYFRQEKKCFLYYAAIWLGLQVYSSSYIFLFLSIATAACWFSFFVSDKFSWQKQLKWMAIYAAILLLVIYPFLHLYVIHSLAQTGFNPMNLMQYCPSVCITLSDFIRPLNGNLIYPAFTDLKIDWLRNFHAAFPGILMVLLFIIGSIKNRKAAALWLVFLVGFILSIGPYIQAGKTLFHSPMYYPYAHLHFSNLIRFPVRVYGLCTLALALIAGHGFQAVLNRFPNRNFVLTLAFCTVLLIEQVPAGWQLFPSSKYLAPPKEWLELNRTNHHQVFLFLPSRLFDTDNYFQNEIGETAREHIYMFWKTFGDNNLLNGSNGYVPQMRWKDNIRMAAGVDSASFAQLLRERKVDYLLIAKEMILKGEAAPNLLPFLHSGLLSPFVQNDSMLIYRVHY